MNTSSLTNNEQLAFLKSAYFEALKSFNETNTEEALYRLRTTEDAYMSFIESNDVPSFI
jgi:phage terminase large subunit